MYITLDNKKSIHIPDVSPTPRVIMHDNKAYVLDCDYNYISSPFYILGSKSEALFNATGELVTGINHE